MKVGLVTYNLAKDWDVDAIIKHCEATGFEGVELRTTHAHGVEVTLNAAQRAEVKAKFEDSRVQLAGLGSAFEYHSLDPAEVRKNIEGTREYVKLAVDVGTPGIKVRPNGLQLAAGVPKEKTLEQIGIALRECAEFAKDHGVQIRLEVHGYDTCRVPNIRTILDVADHDNLYVCWNCNQEDLVDGGLHHNFALLANKIALVHMRDLYVEDYPWRHLFALLNGINYRGFSLAEIPESADPERVMRYYRALWLAYQQ